MKEFIVVIVAMIILIAFPIQGLIDAAFDSREQLFDSIVRSYAEKARMEGCFTQAIINDMKTEICNKLPGLTESEISVNATTTKKYRAESYDDDSLITFTVSMPLKNRFVGGYVFGNAEDENNPFSYKCSGSVSSEALQ